MASTGKGLRDMAWKEQCKIAFKANANAILHKRGGKGVVKVLRQLSRESGIPYGTLRRWYYPDESVPKNGKNSNEKPEQPLIWRRVVKRIENLNSFISENELDTAFMDVETEKMVRGAMEILETLLGEGEKDGRSIEHHAESERAA